MREESAGFEGEVAQLVRRRRIFLSVACVALSLSLLIAWQVYARFLKRDAALQLALCVEGCSERCQRTLFDHYAEAFRARAWAVVEGHVEGHVEEQRCRAPLSDHGLTLRFAVTPLEAPFAASEGYEKRGIVSLEVTRSLASEADTSLSVESIGDARSEDELAVELGLYQRARIVDAVLSELVLSAPAQRWLERARERRPRVQRERELSELSALAHARAAEGAEFAAIQAAQMQRLIAGDQCVADSRLIGLSQEFVILSRAVRAAHLTLDDHAILGQALRTELLLVPLRHEDGELGEPRVLATAQGLAAATFHEGEGLITFAERSAAGTAIWRVDLLGERTLLARAGADRDWFSPFAQGGILALSERQGEGEGALSLRWAPIAQDRVLTPADFEEVIPFGGAGAWLDADRLAVTIPPEELSARRPPQQSLEERLGIDASLVEELLDEEEVARAARLEAAAAGLPSLAHLAIVDRQGTLLARLGGAQEHLFSFLGRRGEDFVFLGSGFLEGDNEGHWLLARADPALTALTIDPLPRLPRDLVLGEDGALYGHLRGQEGGGAASGEETARGEVETLVQLSWGEEGLSAPVALEERELHLGSVQVTRLEDGAGLLAQERSLPPRFQDFPIQAACVEWR